MDHNQELYKLNQDFNNKFDSRDYGFSLTKMFKKKGIINNITKAFLLFSLSLGAFSNVANAKTQNIINNQDIIQTQVINNENKKNDLVNYDSLDELTPELLEQVVENNSSGIWKDPVSGDVVIVTQVGKLDLDSKYTQNKIEAFFKSKGIELNTKMEEAKALDLTYTNSSVRLINLNKNQKINDNDYINKEKQPLLYKFKDDFQAHHEYAHVSKSQLEKKELYSKNMKKSFFIKGTLLLENASDLNAVATLIKTKDLNMVDTLQILDELSEVRKEGFSERFDLDHATHGSLIAFKESLIRNPKNLDLIKKMNYEELEKMTAEYAFKSFEQLRTNKDIDLITKKDLKKDLEQYISKGKIFNKDDSIVYKKMANLKDINGTKAVDSINYEGFLNELSNRMESKNITSEKTVDSFRYTKKHLRGLNIVKLIDGYEIKDSNQDKLDNIFNNSENKMMLSKIKSQLEISQNTKNNLEISITKLSRKIGD